MDKIFPHVANAIVVMWTFYALNNFADHRPSDGLALWCLACVSAIYSIIYLIWVILLIINHEKRQ